ncbi:hypothetical protein J4Q44_G00088720 [Coregonus suidteri]|uniref:Uncharacterized protein n=1 Tax=Coregonus suidteri TaxID=861788 RepID=A0AAN8M8M2_9TELE
MRRRTGEDGHTELKMQLRKHRRLLYLQERPRTSDSKEERGADRTEREQSEGRPTQDKHGIFLSSQRK